MLWFIFPVNTGCVRSHEFFSPDNTGSAIQHHDFCCNQDKSEKQLMIFFKWIDWLGQLFTHMQLITLYCSHTSIFSHKGEGNACSVKPWGTAGTLQNHYIFSRLRGQPGLQAEYSLCWPSILTTAFFMPVLEAPPPPATITSPVLGSTLMEYKGNGALYRSGTFLFPIVIVQVTHSS